MQDVATANRPASNRGDDRFRTRTDLALEVEHVKVVSTGFVFVTAVIATNFLVTTRTESIFTEAGQNDHADAFVVARICQCIDHLFDGLRTKSVANLRARNGDFRNTIFRFVIVNIFVTAAAVLPVDRSVKFFF